MSNINVNTLTPLAGTTGTVSVSGSLHVSGNLSANGTLTLGDANTDNILLNAEFTSSLIPDLDNKMDLGTSTKRWRTAYIGNVTATSASISYISSSSPTIFAGDILPDVQNENDIGSVAKRWEWGYINSMSVHFITASTGYGLEFGKGTHLIPEADSSATSAAKVNLGKSSRWFANAYVASASLGPTNISGSFVLSPTEKKGSKDSHYHNPGAPYSASKFTVQNEIHTQMADSYRPYNVFTIEHQHVDEDSVIICNKVFSHAMGGLSQSIFTAEPSGGYSGAFKLRITGTSASFNRDTGGASIPIPVNTPFTASFVIIN
jgi:hypothetical protein